MTDFHGAESKKSSGQNSPRASAADRYYSGEKMLLYDVDKRPGGRSIEEVEGVVYGHSDNGRPLHLNILLPAHKGNRARPAIVWIHGGGWEDQSSRVNAVIDYFGPTDLNTIAGPQNGPKEAHIRHVVGMFLGGAIEEKRSLAAVASPISYATPETPPFLIIHG